MTKQEIKAKSDAKIKQITDLCELLKITLTAEEVVLPGGLIRKAVYYFDNEQYPQDEPTKENHMETTIPENKVEVPA